MAIFSVKSILCQYEKTAQEMFFINSDFTWYQMMFKEVFPDTLFFLSFSYTRHAVNANIAKTKGLVQRNLGWPYFQFSHHSPQNIPPSSEGTF